MGTALSVHEELRAEQVRSRRREQLLEGENEALKLIVERAPLETVLETLVRLAEQQALSGILASILLLDRDRVHLRHGAAPSLPAAYSSAIDGIEIGPAVGSCGTAAYLGKPVIVSDIMTDPLWDNFRALAGEFGLRACWSYPILSSRRTVLGTFALYYREARTPEPEDEGMISILTRTAALAIEHHNAELSLAESEERFRSLTRSAPLGVFMTDATGAFSYVNPRFVELSAFDYEKTFEYWLEAAADDPSLASEWRGAVSNHTDFIREFSISREGAARAVGLRAAPMKSNRGEYLGYVGTVEDISDRLKTDVELRRESSLRRAIEDSVPAGIAIIGRDRTFTYVNRAFTEILGWSTEELLGKAFADFSGNSVDFADDGSRSRFEMQLRRNTGQEFDGLVSAAPFNSENGEIAGWVVSVLDVTEAKRSASGVAR